MSAIRPKYLNAFLWSLAFYALIAFALSEMGAEKFEHLHLSLDTSNAILSLLLAVFLLSERYAIQPNVRNYLVIGFGFAAGTELLHALVGIEWFGSLAWISEYAHIIRPATWPPSTYILPLSMAAIYWLKQRHATLSPAKFAWVMATLTFSLFALSFYLPRYVDTGILGIQRPTQIPLLFLWGWIVLVYWQKRHEHRLFEGLALMGVLLFLSDLFMLYSTSPHEKFTMIAHAGKFIAYVLLHTIQMQIAAEDSRAREAAETALLQEKERLQHTLGELKYQKFALDQHAMVSTTDVEGTITYVNQKLCDVSGYSAAELLGKNHRLFNSKTHPVEFFQDLYQTITAGKVWRGEICNRAKTGDLYWLDTTIVPYLDDTGKVTQYISMRSDINERKQAEAAVHKLAFYDALTNLPNRRLLNDRLGRASANNKRAGHYGALMFIDLDYFKPINDQYGHAVGDALLIEVAHRITSRLRESDTASRFGGDEFVVMLNELGANKEEAKIQAGLVAEKIRQALAAPYSLQLSDEENAVNIEHHCSASIGFTLFPEADLTHEDVILHADIAMYKAKENGRNTVSFFSL
jgi:diguanylate cyclase (GGDEF)-like protein/PAS domain S-box-containing protein